MTDRRRLLRDAALPLLLLAGAATARAQDDLAKRLDQLTKEVAELKGAGGSDEGRKPEWLTIGGDLRVRHDILRAKIPSYTQFTGIVGGVPTFAAMPAATVRNDSLLTNRLGLNFHVKPADSVTLTVRLLAYKTWGMEDQGATQAGYFADRQNAAFDGTVGHVPSDNSLRVDEAYATVKDLFGSSAWFSAGRRPSTGGVPTNVREDREVNGASGIPGLLVDYAFDGATLGIAPEISKLPGFAAKLCYGRAYDSGFSSMPGGSPRDTDMLGVSLLAYETPDMRADLQYQRGFNIMDTIPGPNVRTNLGDIQEWGFSLIRTVRDLGPGDLNGFASAALSASSPNSNRYNAGFGPGNPGLMCDAGDCDNKTGSAYYVGARYDLHKTKTKLGAEFNHGSQNWITFVPAGDDVWTSKLGTRGNVYEVYAIQDLGRAPIARDGRVLFRLGWQYYDFRYTGSNSWIGGSHSIKDLTGAQAQFMAPIKSAYDVYTTFEVRF